MENKPIYTPDVVIPLESPAAARSIPVLEGFKTTLVVYSLLAVAAGVGGVVPFFIFPFIFPFPPSILSFNPLAVVPSGRVPFFKGFALIKFS